MEDTMRDAIVLEIRAELGIAPSVPTAILNNYVKEGEAKLNGLVTYKTINFDLDITSRALLKNYVRYAYFGALDEFNVRYLGDLYDAQIRNI